MSKTAIHKVFIIDDEVDLTQMIGYQFQAKGFEVQTANNGVEALEKVHKFHPDLIILDMNMPKMGGIEFFSKICAADGKPLYPVLVLTARANIQGLFEDLAIDRFMIKPFDIHQLIKEAESIIQKHTISVDSKWNNIDRRGRRLCLVEHDQKTFEALTTLFATADYTVIPARNGPRGMEKAIANIPDVFVVHLGLPDIAGDELILQLKQTAKTKDVKCLLYSQFSIEHDRQVMERISRKTGILTFVQYQTLQELLLAVDKQF